MLKVTDTLDHIIFDRVQLAKDGLELTTVVVIDTGFIGSYKSNINSEICRMNDLNSEILCEIKTYIAKTLMIYHVDKKIMNSTH